MTLRSSECSWRGRILRCRLRSIANLGARGQPPRDNQLRVALPAAQTTQQTWRAKPKMAGNCEALDRIRWKEGKALWRPITLQAAPSTLHCARCVVFLQLAFQCLAGDVARE